MFDPVFGLGIDSYIIFCYPNDTCQLVVIDVAGLHVAAPACDYNKSLCGMRMVGSLVVSHALQKTF